MFEGMVILLYNLVVVVWTKMGILDTTALANSMKGILSY